MSLVREVPQTTLRPSVVQVIDTQTDKGIEQAREQTAIPPRTSEPDKNVQAISEPEQKTENRPTPQQQADFTSFVTQYFGGAALRESQVAGKKESLQFSKLNEEIVPVRHGFEQNEPERKVSQPPAPSIQNAVQEELLPREAASTTLGDELSGYSMVGVAFDTYIILQNTKQPMV